MKDKSTKVGIENLQNTCYANAVLQSLYHCPRFLNLALLLHKFSTSSDEAEESKAQVEEAFPTLLELGFLFEKLEEAGKKSFIRPDNVFWSMRKFFNGDKDPQKQRIELDQSSMTSPRRKKNHNKPQPLPRSREVNIHVLGPQQDSQEFLAYLLSQLHEEQATLIQRNQSKENSSSNNDNWEESIGRRSGRSKSIKVKRSGLEIDHIETSISTLFQAKIRNTFKESKGSKPQTSATSQPYFGIPLEVEGRGIRSLEDSLEQNFKEEKIFDNSGASIKKRVSEFEYLPHVLIFHLKRFAYNVDSGTARKVTKTIEYPMELEIPYKFISPQYKLLMKTQGSQFGEKDGNEYKLFSVVCHQGSSIDSGHYVNYSYDFLAKQWLCCSDEDVTSVSEDSVLANEDAYLLFYTR